MECHRGEEASTRKEDFTLTRDGQISTTESKFINLALKMHIRMFNY